MLWRRHQLRAVGNQHTHRYFTRIRQPFACSDIRGQCLANFLCPKNCLTFGKHTKLPFQNSFSVPNLKTWLRAYLKVDIFLVNRLKISGLWLFSNSFWPRVSPVPVVYTEFYSLWLICGPLPCRCPYPQSSECGLVWAPIIVRATSVPSKMRSTNRPFMQWNPILAHLQHSVRVHVEPNTFWQTSMKKTWT